MQSRRQSKLEFHQNAEPVQHSKLEDGVFIWLEQARKQNLPVSGNLKALKLAELMHIADFIASDGWLDIFQKRQGITFKQCRAKLERWIYIPFLSGSNRSFLLEWQQSLLEWQWQQQKSVFERIHHMYCTYTLAVYRFVRGVYRFVSLIPL